MGLAGWVPSWPPGWLILALCLVGASADAGELERLKFDTHGGDAWAFSKVISGTISRNGCDTVTVLTSLGRSNARITQNRFTATVDLREGHNSVSAICVRAGKRVGDTIRQDWNVRLPPDVVLEQNQVAAGAALHNHPDWRACTILYGVAPALFGSHGLSDVTRRLDEIARLGATALWLSPITDAPPGDFGYAVTDPFRLRKNLGTPGDLRKLVMQAHARGIRVLLDFVTNHLSKEHPYFKDAVRFGPRSPYFDWFERDRNGQPVHYFDWSSLENLNYDNPEVRNYMLAGITSWFRDFPVDGFRADAAWAVRQRDPAFWPVLRQEVEHLRPGALLLAEASARDPYYMSEGFDAAYDWTTELGHWAWQGVFGPQGQLPDLGLLRSALTNNGHGFTDSSGVLHFLNNNDTGKRFVAVHGIEAARLAAALLLTIPGIPLIYAGDEVGASFEPYEHPLPLRWGDPDHLLPLYRRLTKLRREIPALRSSGLRLLNTTRDASVLAYVREVGEPEQAVAVVLNFGMSSFDLPLASIQKSGNSAASWWAEDLLMGTRAVAPPDAETIRVAPHGALLLRRATAANSATGSQTPSSSCSSGAEL